MEIKEKWRGMVSNAKKERNKIAYDRKKTGGGKKPESPKGQTSKIIALFGEEFREESSLVSCSKVVVTLLASYRSKPRVKTL